MGGPGIVGWLSWCASLLRRELRRNLWSQTTGPHSPSPCRTQSKFEPHLYPCIQELHGSQGLVCLVLCSNQLDTLCSSTGFDTFCHYHLPFSTAPP